MHSEQNNVEVSCKSCKSVQTF